MPRVATPIPNTYDSQTRPIALATIRKVCELLDLPADTKVLFAGAAEQVPMTGSTLNFQGDPSTFNSEMRVTAEVHEDAVEERILTTAVFQDENVPFFVDNQLGVRLFPIYSNTEMTIQFTFRAANRATARRFRDEALSRTAQGRQDNVHEIAYHYPIPYEYLHLLKHIWELREAQGGYDETFDKWMTDHLSAKATNLTTVTGTKPMLVIAENQIRPLGWFDFSALPQPEQKDNDTGPYIVAFEYHLTFDKVIGAVAQYPLVVHNQLIDEAWYETPHASGNILDPERRVGVGSYSRYALDHIARLNQCHCPPKVGVRVPEFDDWSPKTVHPSTMTLATLLIGVNPENLNEIIDLKDIPDYALDADVQAFLLTEAPFLNTFTESVVYLSLYRGDVPVDDGSLVIDNQLVVRSNRPLDLRENYHLRIALVSDLLHLTPGAFERFRSSGQACLNILSTLQWTLRRDGYLPKLLGGKYVAKSDLLNINHLINNQRSRLPGTAHTMLTVGNFLIATHRSTDYGSFDPQADSATGNGPASGASSGTPLSGADTDC
jgi:hypothetical protein